MRVAPALMLVALLAAACGGAAARSPSKHPRKSVFAELQRAARAAEAAKEATPKAAPKAPEAPRRVPPLDRGAPRVSPDGKRVAYLAASGGAPNVWLVDPRSEEAPKAVTHDASGVREIRWAFDGRRILYVSADARGHEHVHVLDTRTGRDRDLTRPGADARIVKTSPRHPSQALVAMNDRDSRAFDLYRVDLATGTRVLLAKDDGTSRFDADEDLRVRFVEKTLEDGSVEVFESLERGASDKDALGTRELRPALTIAREDAATTRVLGFDKTGAKAFMVDGRGRDTAALTELDVATKATAVLISDDEVDVDGAVIHPTERTVQAAVATGEHVRWHVLDPRVRDALDAIRAVASGDLRLTSRSLDGAVWLLAVYEADAPVRYVVFDRATKKVTPLTAAEPTDRTR